MAKYTIYNTDTSLPEAEGKPHPCADGVSRPVGMPDNFEILLEVNGADPAYDPATHKIGNWGSRVYDVVTGTATRTREVVALSVEELAEATRKTKRDSIAATWHALPDYIRANYSHLYEVCNKWLDENEDALAITIVQDADPLQSISNDPVKLQTFNDVKAQMIALVQDLSA